MQTIERDFSSWSGFAASVPGAGHIRRDLPCQDASRVLTSPRPAVIVCDGRGSAPLSHFGAQAAVRSFEFQLGVLEPLIANTLDDEEGMPERWDRLCRLLYRALAQAKLELMQERNERAEKEVKEKDFDFTASFAVVGKRRIGCFQVGDGAIVLRQDGELRTVFPPDKGEFANQTHFIRAGKDGSPSLHTAMFPAGSVSGIAVTSDGPEHLMFRLNDMTPGPIFTQLFDDLTRGELRRQDLLDYLTRPAWNDDPRGTDDRTVAILCPERVEAESEPVAPAEPAASTISDAQSIPGPDVAGIPPSAAPEPETDDPKKTPVAKEPCAEPPAAPAPHPHPHMIPKRTFLRRDLAICAAIGLLCIGMAVMQLHWSKEHRALRDELRDLRQSVTKRPPQTTPAEPAPAVRDDKTPAKPAPAVRDDKPPAKPAPVAGDEKKGEKVPDETEKSH